MARSVLIELSLFLAPFAAYAVLLLVTRGSLVPEHWSLRALAGLTAAALVLVILGLFLFEHGSMAPTGSRYVPAQMKDGVFVPGHHE